MSAALVGTHSRILPNDVRRVAFTCLGKPNLCKPAYRKQCVSVPMSAHEQPRLCKAFGSSNGVNGHVKGQPTPPRVSVTELRNLTLDALRALGYTETEAGVLIELRDNNQGIVKITSGGLKKPANAGEITIEKETRLSTLINGNNQPGMIVLNQGVRTAIEKAQSHGFGIVGTNHTASSTGALGYFAELISSAGLIGMVLAQSPEFVAPYGAKQAIFGTNPIALSIPAEGGCVTMDMATAAYAWFGLLEAKSAGRSIPEGVAHDADGVVTTDPCAVLEGGAIRVFDRSHKGSALSLMVELLAGPLVGAAVADKLEERNWGNLVVALDPALLGDPATFRAKSKAVFDRVKAAERLPGVGEILLPGERGDRLAAERVAANSIPVEESLLAGLRTTAAKWQQQAASAPPSSQYTIATRLLHPSKSSVKDPYGAVGPPLYQTATFEQPSSTTFGDYDYTRSGNPTRTMLEEQWAELEGGDRGFAFASGMAAIAVVCRLVGSGEHVVAGDDIYGGTSRLLSQVLPAQGVAVSNVDMTNLRAVKAAMIPGKTKLMIVESPTNPRMQVCDIKALAAIAREAGAICCVDNSILTPLFQRPLELGADISMVSGTKFVGGHSDVTAGLLAVKGKELAGRVYFLQNAEGAHLGPFDCWLALRGLKTMALRMERQAENAGRLARFLEAHPLVKRVNYPGLKAFPGHSLNTRQSSSAGSLLSFETGNVEASKIIVEETKLFKITVSFGSVASLISLPCYMSHASIPADIRASRGLPDDLVRVSTGIEDVNDLLADLEQAMNKAAEHVGWASNGFKPAHDASMSIRELELSNRVQELEVQLRAR